MKKKLLLFAMSLMISANGVYADEPVDSLIYLNGVVVSANRIATNRNSVPLSMSVINRAQIEASSESALLPVLSERVPGLFVTEKGITGFGISDGAAGTINIRGVGQSNKVLVLFDGQPQWAGLFGHSLPDTYVASDVERVEVIRGPGSLIYGSNAMGGVINIITRRPNETGRHSEARVMYGSFNTQKYMINNAYSTGKFSSFISLNHDYTDGHRSNSDFRITNGFVNLAYNFSSHYKVTGDASLAKYRNHNPGAVTNPISENIANVFRGTTSLGFENHYDKVSGALKMFYNWGAHKINDGYYAGKDPRDYLFHSHDHNVGMQLYQTFKLIDGNSFTTGFDYKNWGGHAWNANFDGTDDEIINKNVNEVAGYVIMQQDLFRMLSLNAGVRYEHNSTFGGEWIPQAGVTFRPFEGNVIKVSLSKGFRSPNIRELYMFMPANPDLLPESMKNYEVSVGQSFLDNRLSTELTLFYIDGKNMIQVTRIDGKPKNVNTGAFKNKGIEFETSYRINPHWNVEANYSYLHTDIALLAAPKHKAFVDLTYRNGRFTADANVQSIFGLYINTTTALKENYTMLNAKVSYHLGDMHKGTDLFLKGDNLTATRYSINEGFPMPKAIFMGGIDVKF